MVAWVVEGFGIIIKAVSHVTFVTSWTSKGWPIRLSERVEELVIRLLGLIEPAIEEYLSACNPRIWH